MAPGCVTVVGCVPSLVGSMQVGARYEASGRAMADYVPQERKRRKRGQIYFLSDWLS